MARSRLVSANEKIAQSLTHGFETVEKAVVGGYTKIEDRFVDKYLTEEGGDGAGGQDPPAPHFR